MSEPIDFPPAEKTVAMPVNRRRALALAGAGALACGAGALGGYWWINRPSQSAARAGEAGKLLDASFPSLDDKTMPMTTWRGKTLIANFWATWCGPCREEMPDFVKAQTAYGDKGLQFVGLAIDRKEPVARFARELNINYPILIADPAWLDAVKTMGNPQGVLPFTLVFSPKGEVLLTRVGRLKYSEITTIMS
ncbi:MAG: TlpA disulfide reductase family protein [Casimicrobium sp.]